MFKKILLGLAALLVVFVIVVALQPRTFRVERSLAIAAPGADIFPHLNDLKQSAVWSPWLKLDPAIKIGYDGPIAGVGASQTWAGNSEVGAGRQTITASRPNELVHLKLEFTEPFKSTCDAELALKPDGNQTVVTWSMSGESGFIARAVCLFMDQDKMIGTPFEEGLTRLKSIVENPAKK